MKKQNKCPFELAKIEILKLDDCDILTASPELIDPSDPFAPGEWDEL